jgi:hypothetical protein
MMRTLVLTVLLLTGTVRALAMPLPTAILPPSSRPTSPDVTNIPLMTPWGILVAMGRGLLAVSYRSLSSEELRAHSRRIWNCARLISGFLRNPPGPAGGELQALLDDLLAVLDAIQTELSTR